MCFVWWNLAAIWTQGKIKSYSKISFVWFYGDLILWVGYELCRRVELLVVHRENNLLSASNSRFWLIWFSIWIGLFLAFCWELFLLVLVWHIKLSQGTFKKKTKKLYVLGLPFFCNCCLASCRIVTFFVLVSSKC